MDEVQFRNTKGQWLPAIPEPLFYGWKMKRAQCKCRAKFRSRFRYRQHYCYFHLYLGLD